MGGGRMETRSDVPDLRRKARRGVPLSLQIWKKYRDKEFDDKELFTRQIGKRGF